MSEIIHSRRKDDYMSLQTNICFDCTKGVNECCWMRNMTPVEGWTAEKIEYRLGIDVAPAETYYITDCPKFSRARKQKIELDYKNCKRCGKEYIPRGTGQKYCSPFCVRMASIQ